MIATEVKIECVTSEISLLTEMRESRESANSAYISFCDNYRRYPTHTFCFYEGEDGKYYNQRIRAVVGKDIIPIKSGNKNNTLKAWRKISKDSNYHFINKMFFVDRDMDELPEDINKDLYVTPCYSVENLYVCVETFASIIESEFSINKIHDDYKKCIDLFVCMYEQFCELMVEFNALVLVRKQKQLGNGNVSLSGIKTTQMVDIEMYNVTKGSKYDLFIDDLKSRLQAKDEDIENAIEFIRTMGDFSNNFRGKNQIEFLIALIELLKKAHRDKDFFSESQSSVSINLTKNRLSELSQYARTPECLIDFLENHKPQLHTGDSIQK